MAYTENSFASKASRWAERGQSDDFRREELIRVIEHSVENASSSLAVLIIILIIFIFPNMPKSILARLPRSCKV